MEPLADPMRTDESYIRAADVMAGTDELYRAMFERSPVPMWIWDRTTMGIVAVNDAAVAQYGYSPAEVATMTIFDLRPAEDIPAVKAALASGDALDDNRVWRHKKKDGTIFSVEVRGRDVTIGGRELRLAVITDVTGRISTETVLARTEDQLRQAQKMEAIGLLAGGVAHDFNNVLTVIQSCAFLLDEVTTRDDARHEDIAAILRASERATAITRQLLAVSRHSVSAPQSLDLDAVVQDFAPMLRRLVGDTVKVVIHRATVPSVIADLGQLEQVMMNLAVNARDAMPRGGRLTIECRRVEVDDDTATARAIRAGHYVELAITDTGTGMDRATQQRIFEPFFTTKDAGRGTGLGLAIVHGIVAQAGGAVLVYSEPGLGTTFRIQLPVAAGAVAAVAADAIAAPRTLPPVRVLVIDDEPDVRGVAMRILGEAGCTVIAAATAAEGRKICVGDDGQIDIVLLDVVLADGRGDTLIHELRTLRPGLAFVQMSGYPAGALTPAGGTPEHLLAKPFSPSELRAAIARCCIGIDDPATTPSVTVVTATAARRRILLADDDADLRRTYARMLRKADYDLVEADSGYAAIAALEAGPIDVVVSDVHMPDGTGLDLLRAIRRIDLDVPVILMTGEPSIDAAAEAVEVGAFRYLTKPLEVGALLKTIEHAARAHALARLRREAYAVTGAHTGAADRAGLEVRFEQALERMTMVYQPIVHARTGALFGIEALMRTTEPSIPTPQAILDAAIQLDRLPLVGRKTRSLAATAFGARTDDITLFVNLHPEDIHDADLVDPWSLLAQLAPRVILEVTERASLESSPALADRIARLRGLGFRLAVDDIGAGYSGLTSFTELMPEVVKIDMSLVRDVHKSPLKQRTIGALCALCREVGTLVVGEGVETHDEREALIALGCDLLQGYVIARPSPELP